MQRFQASQPWESAGGEVEEIEVVHVAAGSHPDAPGEPGLSMTWHQDSDSYGLVMPIARLAAQAGDLDAVPFYLRLAIDEPHRSSPDGSRVWFFDLPAGPY